MGNFLEFSSPYFGFTCLVLFFVGFFTVIIAYALYVQVKRQNLTRKVPVRRGSCHQKAIFIPDMVAGAEDGDEFSLGEQGKCK